MPPNIEVKGPSNRTSMPANPQPEGLEEFRQRMFDRASKRDQERCSIDTDPEMEGPGPAAPRSPLRGLPTHREQPPPAPHPPPGTPPPTTTGPLGTSKPGETLRPGFTRPTYQAAQELGRRMKAERQRRKKAVAKDV